MIARVTQAQADDAAAAAARFWPEFGRRWPWTRAASLAPVYQRVGEQTVALLRTFPAIQWSNQARWYRRVVRDTPAIIAMTPDALRAEAGKLAPGAASSTLDGKHVLTLIYLADKDAPVAPAPLESGEPPVAKTLLASAELDAPLYAAQLAHELLNCFCHTAWDGETLRSGVRFATGAMGSGAERGGALNDLLIDAMLVQYLPVATALRSDELFDGAQGPYWRLTRTLATRLRGVPALSALFSGATDAMERFERGIAQALDTVDAANMLDTLTAAHDWQGLQRLLGSDS